MQNIGASYSSIISPKNYIHIMSNEHLYISISDRFIAKKITELAKPSAEVVEFGCGPGRMLSLISKIEGINLTGIDLDRQFLEYAKGIIKNPSVRLIEADVENYQHDKKADIIYSHGLHHHVAKGVKTHNYLKNVYNNLKEDGYYILSDEFTANYADLKDREIKIVIWYSHIIAHALKNNYSYLAQEEAKILLDDLFEGRQSKNIKSKEQIDFVLTKVTPINQSAIRGEMETASQLAQEFLTELESYHNLNLHGDPSLDLSRGDYKNCDKDLRKEVEEANFRVESVQSFGPVETIGAMSIYILRKGKL